MARREVTGRKRDVCNEPSPRFALSIPEFCEAHGFSEGMFYKMKKQHLTPREMKVGTRTLITFEAAAEWRAEREAAGVAKPKVTAAKSARLTEKANV